MNIKFPGLETSWQLGLEMKELVTLRKQNDKMCEEYEFKTQIFRYKM